MSAIVVDKLDKSYGEVRALRDVSLTIERGELFGLIGPDGAGKTTLIRILTTLLLADQGRAELLGLDVVRDFRKIRRMVGYMPGRFSLYQDLSVEENLHFFASVFGTTVEENYHLVKDIYVQLAPFKDRLAGKLSGGMKQKLALCCALIHSPELLILDEPTTGVDPVSRKEFWDMLGRLRASGITILVSTPYMDEAARCERIALLQHGRIIALNAHDALLAEHQVPTFAVRGEGRYALLQALRSYEGTRYAYAFGGEHHLVLNEGDTTEGVRRYLQAQGHGDASVHAIVPTIEDVFIALSHQEQQPEQATEQAPEHG